jgi:hypothetical protein
LAEFTFHIKENDCWLLILVILWNLTKTKSCHRAWTHQDHVAHGLDFFCTWIFIACSLIDVACFPESILDKKCSISLFIISLCFFAPILVIASFDTYNRLMAYVVMMLSWSSSSLRRCQFKKKTSKINQFKEGLK